MKILFVSHAANRSGAPLVLLELLRFLKSQTAGGASHSASILSLRRGVLESEFARYATPFEGAGAGAVVAASKLGAARTRFGDLPVPRKAEIEVGLRAAERQTRRLARWKLERKSQKFDLVYVNSAASGAGVAALEPLVGKLPLVVHVHEMKWALSRCAGWDYLRKRGDLFIAVSGAVRQELIAQGVRSEQIEVVYPLVNFAGLETDQTAARTALRTQIGADDSAFLVGGCGTMEWRKGGDLWGQVAGRVLREMPDARFVWLGGEKNEFWRGVKFDLEKMGVSNRVHFLGATDKPQLFFAGLDAFALTSREDPFPLVAVEAAAQGVPTTCFLGATGTSELLENRFGESVGYGDTGAMAQVLVEWSRNEKRRAQVGEAARSSALEKCDAAVGAAKIVELLEKITRK